VGEWMGGGGGGRGRGGRVLTWESNSRGMTNMQPLSAVTSVTGTHTVSALAVPSAFHPSLYEQSLPPPDPAPAPKITSPPGRQRRRRRRRRQQQQQQQQIACEVGAGGPVGEGEIGAGVRVSAALRGGVV
jgi:hypothetical protein